MRGTWRGDQGSVGRRGARIRPLPERARRFGAGSAAGSVPAPGLADVPGLLGAFDFGRAAQAAGAGSAVGAVTNDAPEPGLTDFVTGSASEPTGRNLGADGWACEFLQANQDYLTAAFTDLTEVSDLSLAFRLAIRGNGGNYRGFVGCREGTNPDYVYGLACDLGVNPTSAFDFFTAYTPGATDYLTPPNLLTDAVTFDTFCTFVLVRDSAAELLRVYLDGVAQGTRSFSGGGDCDGGTLYVGGRGESASVGAFTDCYLQRLLVSGEALTGAGRSAAEGLVEAGW